MQRKQEQAIKRNKDRWNNTAGHARPLMVIQCRVRHWLWDRKEWSDWSTGFIRPDANRGAL